MRRSVRRRLEVGIVALGLAALTASCGGGGSNARLRLMNASPDEGNVDALIDSKTIATGIGFGTASNYASVGSGSRHLQIELSGTSTPVVDETLTLSSGLDTTLLLANFATNLNAIQLQDDNSPPTSGDAKLRVVNAASSLAPADVYVVSDGTDINSVAPFITNMEFESASTYATLTPGTYRIWFTAPGQKFVFIDSGPLSISAGQVRTVVGMNNSLGAFSSVVLSDLN